MIPDPHCAVTSTLLRETDEGVLVADLNGAARYINPVAASLLGVSPEDPVHLRDVAGVNLQRRLMSEDLADGDPDALSRPKEGFGELEESFRVQGRERKLRIRAGRVQEQDGMVRLLLLRDVTELRRMEARLGDPGPPRISSRDPAMEALLEKAEQVAPTDASVTLQGESGVGKGLVARHIHHRSLRAGGPLVEVNCAAIPENLLEAELFGHVKGAFTGAVSDRKGRFAEAEGGTLFLDEVGDLPLSLQAKLLKVLQDKRYEPVGSDRSQMANVRIIAASNRDLEAAVAEGDMRTDLYYRLCVFPLRIPPLRERVADTRFLIDHFREQLGAAHHGTAPALSAEARQVLLAYSWPGNVRELENAIEHALICCGGETVQPQHLPASVTGSAAAAPGGQEEGEASERAFLQWALEEAGGNRAEAARLLGIHRSTLWRRLQRAGLAEEGED
jgi:PAS domain S-box-containing protein